MKLRRRFAYIFGALLLLFVVGYLIYTGTHLIPASEGEEIEIEEQI